MSDAQIRQEIERRAAATSYRALGEELGISPTMLNMVVHRKTPVSARVAAAMGYRKVVKFERLPAA